ncbi:cholinesterase-like isoform X2 [Nelusetta ayraudi]
MATLSCCAPPPLPLLLLLLLLPFPFAASVDLVVTTNRGQVRGTALTVLGGQVRAFLGIPYGKPPVGNLRFRVPQPADKWEGVREATQFSNTCFQLQDTMYPGFLGAEMWNPNTPVSEDCLYLNVWTPHLNNSQQGALPVMIWIYGGAFTSGTSSLDLYDGRVLARSENVVVVSMNYRVGALGFLALPDNDNIRGNAGLWDQRLAIQWTVDNIAAFGGDRNKVTLFGESAGSASVGLHVLSPGSNILFQRAVMQSGVPTAFWATVALEQAWVRGQNLGTALGCSNSTPAVLETCLQQANVTEVAMRQYNVFASGELLGIPFVPVVDGAFLPSDVDTLLTSNTLLKTELLLGLNHDEGTYFLMYGVPGFGISNDSLISRARFLQNVELLEGSLDSVTRQAVIFEYSDWANVNNGTKNRDYLGKMVTDSVFICVVQDFASRYSVAGGKPFLYFFDHRSSINPWPAWMGTMHGYEIEFVFGRPLNASLGYTQAEVNMSRNFMAHWANFARTGNPGINGSSWSLFTPQIKEYYTLNTEPAKMMSMLRADECRFWTSLVPAIRQLSDDLDACRSSAGLKLAFDPSRLAFLLLLLVTFLW